MTSKARSYLMGCGIGCAALVVLAIIAVVSFAVWISRPGELLEPVRLLGRDTTGYAEWTLRLEDPGTEGFVRQLVQTIQETPVDGEGILPRFVRPWLERRRNQQTRKDLERLFPMVAAWTLERGTAEHPDRQLGSISVQQIGHQFVVADWVLGWILDRSDGSRTYAYRSERIYQLASEDRVWTFFIRRGALFLTSDLTTAELAIDRLETPDTEERRQPTDLEQLFAEAKDDPGTLRAALTNRGGEILRLLARVCPESILESEPWRATQGGFATGALQADGTFSATLELVGPDEAWALANADLLTAGLEGCFERFTQLEVRGAASSERVRIDLRIPDLIESLERLLDEDDDVKETAPS